jgi:hypothetical protein
MTKQSHSNTQDSGVVIDDSLEERATSTSLPTSLGPVASSQSKGKAPEGPLQAPPHAKTKALGIQTSSVGGKTVQIRLSKRERLKQLRLTSKENVGAEDFKWTEEETIKLRTFSEFVNPIKAQINLFGKQLPMCRHSLVNIQLTPVDDRVKHICIEGLSREEDIVCFHAVMSQRRYRKLYEPWKLCYEASKLVKAAAVDLGAGESSAEKHQQHSICGAPVMAMNKDGAALWFSTAGGLVQITYQGKEGVYAMTSSHRPDFAPPADSLSSLNASWADTVVDDDLPEDVESPLVFLSEKHADEEDDGIQQDSILESARRDAIWDNFRQNWGFHQPNTITPSEVYYILGLQGNGQSELSISFNSRPTVMKDALEGPHCLFIPVDQEFCQTNFVTIEVGNSMGRLTGARRRYVTGIGDDPSGRPVFISTGFSGACTGNIAMNPSFVTGMGDEVTEVWTVDLDDGNSKNSKPGEESVSFPLTLTSH